MHVINYFLCLQISINNKEKTLKHLDTHVGNWKLKFNLPHHSLQFIQSCTLFYQACYDGFL